MVINLFRGLGRTIPTQHAPYISRNVSRQRHIPTKTRKCHCLKKVGLWPSITAAILGPRPPYFAKPFWDPSRLLVENVGFGDVVKLCRQLDLVKLCAAMSRTAFAANRSAGANGVLREREAEKCSLHPEPGGLRLGFALSSHPTALMPSAFADGKQPTFAFQTERTPHNPPHTATTSHIAHT